jgi:thioredoxin reductase
MSANTHFFFEAFLDNDETRKLFHQFLSDSKTEEPMLFIRAVEQYQITKSDINRYSSAMNIIATYIDVGAPQEINISEKTRHQIQSEFSHVTPTNCSRLLFDNTLNDVLLDLKQDTFKRFLASSLFTKFLQHKQSEFNNDEEKFENYLASLTVYDPAIFNSHAELAPEKEVELTKSQYDNEELLDTICEKIAVPYIGIQIRDVRVKLKTYHRAFRGKDIITWLASHLQVTREEAVTAAHVLQRKRRLFERLDKQKSASASFSVGEIGDDERVYKFANPKKIVIIGGGFGGTTAARVIEDHADVTLIDPNPHMTVTMQNILLLSDPSKLSEHQLSHHACLTKARIIQGFAIDINRAERHVVVDRNGVIETVPYNVVMIATGNRTNIPFPIEYKENCTIIDSRDANSVVQGHNALRVARKVTVIGSGKFGIEFASEVATVFPETTVTIISRDKALLIGGDEENAISEAVRAKISKFSNIKIIQGIVQKIIGRTVSYVSNDVSSTIDSDVVILCTGCKPNSELMLKSLSYSLDDDDHIRVNNRFQVYCCDQSGDDVSTDTTTSTSTSTNDLTSSTNSASEAKYFKNILSFGSVSSLFNHYQNSFITLHQALRCCRIIKAVQHSTETRYIESWGNKAESVQVAIGRSCIVIMNDKIVMNNKIARSHRENFIKNITRLLVGPSKNSLKMAIRINGNFNQDEK